MALRAEWRKRNSLEAIIVIDDDGRTVRAACKATPSKLSRFLTEMGDLNSWPGEEAVNDVGQLPESWGQLVLSRAETGEVLTMDPELFWDGIYHWYRAHGVDYDTPSNYEVAPQIM